MRNFPNCKWQAPFLRLGEPLPRDPSDLWGQQEGCAGRCEVEKSNQLEDMSPSSRGLQKVGLVVGGASETSSVRDTIGL